jgi:hypothetical protein
MWGYIYVQIDVSCHDGCANVVKQLYATQLLWIREIGNLYIKIEVPCDETWDGLPM